MDVGAMRKSFLILRCSRVVNSKWQSSTKCKICRHSTRRIYWGRDKRYLIKIRSPCCISHCTHRQNTHQHSCNNSILWFTVYTCCIVLVHVCMMFAIIGCGRVSLNLNFENDTFVCNTYSKHFTCQSWQYHNPSVCYRWFYLIFSFG